MPMVTWSRQDTPILSSGNDSLTIGKDTLRPTPPAYWYPASRFQTTTSWRTGAGYSNTNPGTETSAFEGTSGTRAEFTKELSLDDRELSVNRQDDNGHEFKTSKDTITVLNRHNVLRSAPTDPFWGSTLMTYRGIVLPFAPQNLQPNWPVIPEPTSTQINADGAKLFNSALPTRPNAALSQFLGELREMLPQLVGHALVKNHFGPRGLGGEHLNMQFGLKPFASDLKKFAAAILRGNTLLEQYARDSDKVERRRRTLYEDRSFVEYPTKTFGFSMYTAGNDYAYGPDHFYMGDPGTTMSDLTTQSVWFSGAFSYHLENLDSWISEAKRYEQKANHLLGTRLTVDVLWELTPWSWMLDWFGNFSAVVQNAEALANDNLVCRWGYVMHHTTVRREFTKANPISVTGDRLPALTVYLDREVKRRTRATPYGFGVDLAALSPARWAILGALGLTKAPNSLHLDYNTSRPKITYNVIARRL